MSQCSIGWLNYYWAVSKTPPTANLCGGSRIMWSIWTFGFSSCTATRWLQTSMFCLLVFVWLRTSVLRRQHTYIWSPKVIDGGYALPPTDRVLLHAHTTHSATGASVSPGHVFGTVFWPTGPLARRGHYVHRPTTVSGVNSKRFCFNVAFVNCAI